MIRFARDLRLIPIVLIASICLLTLKAADLMLGDGPAADDAPAVEMVPHVVHVTPGVPQADAAAGKRSWARQMFNFPGADGSTPPASSVASAVISPIVPPADRANAEIITGSLKTSSENGAPAAKGEAAAAGKGEDAKAPKDGKVDKAANQAPPLTGTIIKTEGVAALPTGAERLILERLQERREQLDTRGRELDIREGLLQAAEKRVEARLVEIKGVEAQITADTTKKDDAEAARFKGLVSMYENMKPRDAAKIFDRLEQDVLIEVAAQIKPRNMADIMAQMSPDVAERLTVELASRARAATKPSGELPKIEGRPMTQ